LKISTPLAGLALLLLAACSTEGKMTPLTAGASAPLPAAATWSLAVEGCPESSQCEELRDTLVSHLISAGLATRVMPAGQPVDFVLDVHVTRMRTVSVAARIILGTLAGRNVVVSTDTLRDQNGAVLRSFEIEGDSAAHPLSGETSLADAYREFATETVTALRQS
jgi:hypothetical protein